VQVYGLRELQPVRATEKSSHFKVVLPEDINQQVFQLLPRFEARGTLAYIHYLQPHQPYDPPAEYLRESKSLGEGSGERASWDDLYDAYVRANQTGEARPATIAAIEDRYRANLRYVDAGVGALLERLEREPWYDESVIVLMADHGDAFFKHRRFGHNVTLYDDMIRIPFSIKFPLSDGIAPKRLLHPAETIDLLPTLFDYLGVPIPEQLEGDSLWSLILGRASQLEEPEVIVASLRRNMHAIRLGDYKYILSAQGVEELYDLRADPDEQRNLIGEQPEKARALRHRLESKVDITRRRTFDTRDDLRADPEMKRLLEILGYVDEELPEAPPPPPGPPAPVP
jgi:arylsulfatase A-like enzyme